MTPLVTVDELAAYLQRSLDRCTAELAVEGASGLIRQYCGWGIARNTAETFTLDSIGSSAITLPTLQVNALTSVTLDGVLLDASEYDWAANGILYRRCGWWPYGPRRVVVLVDHGYSPIPDEVRIVACAIGARMVANPEGLTAKSSGDGSRSFGDLLSDLEMRLISGYRLS